MDYGPGAFIDGTKYIPLVNRDTFLSHDQVRSGSNGSIGPFLLVFKPFLGYWWYTNSRLSVINLG